jgi:hypothetical protein
MPLICATFIRSGPCILRLPPVRCVRIPSAAEVLPGPSGAGCRILTCGFVGGPGRVRTDDTRGVNAVLYQLSYRPRAIVPGFAQARAR